MIEYMTWKEANDKIAKIYEPESNNKFCPLINGACKKDCVCWQKPSIREAGPKTDEKRFYIYNGHCGNAMFFK